MQGTNTDDLNKSEDINLDEWYPDFGASNHVTSNLQNLNLGNKNYPGMHSVCMGNGETISYHTLVVATLKERGNSISVT